MFRLNNNSAVHPVEVGIEVHLRSSVQDEVINSQKDLNRSLFHVLKPNKYWKNFVQHVSLRAVQCAEFEDAPIMKNKFSTPNA